MADAAPQPVAPAQAAADLTGRQLGRYEVLLMLASGGMASVYVARAQGVAGFERLVAIKVLHPHIAHDEEFISMFLDEARLAARLRHPNAVGTLDISDTQGDGYFLVMEYVEGDHFGHLLRNAAKGGERLPVPVVARVVMDSLAGLKAAHDLTDGSGRPLDLVHRDVSPHNLLVGSDGVARITDFGIAKAQVRLSSTRDGQFKGKLSYMAPEQAASGQADQRSDLFSMGIILWEALTGRRLFRGENNADVLNKILNPEVPPPSHFEPELEPFDTVVAQALAREPDDRFQSADDFLDAVETAASSLGGVATPRTVGKAVQRWLGDKIARERTSLQGAIDAAGRSELTPGVLPRPMESGSQPTSPSQIRSRGMDDMTLGAKPSTLAGPLPGAQEDQRKRLVLPITLAVVLSGLIGGGVGAWALIGGGASSPDADTQGATPATQTAAASTEVGAEAPERVAPAAAPPPAPEPAEVATDEASVGEDEEADEDEAEIEDEAPRRRRRRARRGRRRDANAQTSSASTEPQADPASPASNPPSGGDDDDLMLNPYR